jgi:hypothetical protein
MVQPATVIKLTASGPFGGYVIMSALNARLSPAWKEKTCGEHHGCGEAALDPL